MTLRTIGVLTAATTMAMACRTTSPARSQVKDDAPQATQGCHVLVAMSDAATLTAVGVAPLAFGTKDFTFGFLLDEMAIPVKGLLDAGCAVTFANPSGVEPPRDPEGDSPLYFTDGLPNSPPGASILATAVAKLRLDALVPGPEAKAELADALALVTADGSPIRGHGVGSFDAPRKFTEFVGADGEGAGDMLGGFDAIFVPGGYAPMLNLWNDASLGAVLRWFHANGKLTATLCRGGVALRSAAQGGSWIYSGYRMTTYSSVEDDVASLVGGVLPRYNLPFHPNGKLADVGARLDFAPFHSHVVLDGDLLTGENQWSAHALDTAFRSALQARGVL